MRLKNAMDAFQNAPTVRAISAMEVVVWHVGIIGRVEHFKRSEEHQVFRVSRNFTDGRIGEEWEEKLLNADAVRDQFLKVKEWSGALEFLGGTGIFSPLGDTLTWGDFQKWQRFVHLVQEHNELATAMQSGQWSGEYGEVLKALTGIYPSSFFDSLPKPESPEEAKLRADPESGWEIQEHIARQERKRRDLWAWFRKPPGAACSIHWVPKSEEDRQAVWRKLQAGGAMIEFLLPQNALQPVLLIRPSNTLQAIAAAIYGDPHQWRGVSSLRNLQGSVRKLGAHKEKKYCDRERCKNRAHQKNRRANATKKESESVAKKPARKGWEQ